MENELAAYLTGFGQALSMALGSEVAVYLVNEHPEIVVEAEEGYKRWVTLARPESLTELEARKAMMKGE